MSRSVSRFAAERRARQTSRTGSRPKDEGRPAVENCGIDLHLKASEVGVVDESGETNERTKTSTTEKSFVQWFGDR
jgi:hypothetical protein